MGNNHPEKNIRPCVKAMPAIYGFMTPTVTSNAGKIKIGYTERTIQERGHEIFHTANIPFNIVLNGNAIYEVDPKTGKAGPFTDHDFHAFLQAQGVQRDPNTEWFTIDEAAAESMLNDFRHRRAAVPDGEPEPYDLRPEQKDAVANTMGAFKAGAADFLWNAKPRFGKTLAAYDLMARMGMDRILVATNRPAVSTSWHSDYVKFVGGKSGTAFVSESPAVSKRRYVTKPWNMPGKAIAFVSLQDLKGAKRAGGEYDKLDWVFDTEWDMLVIDESHEGASTEKADGAFAAISRKYTLWLSGTPFKQLASGQFPPEHIFDWTYGDEQQAKAGWTDTDIRNPYDEMPKLSLYTYRLSDIVRDELSEGFDEDGHEWAFDLGEFFKVNGRGEFLHDKSVDRFLDALSTQEKFPFSPDFRDPDDPDRELRHTFWLLDRVESARALGRKLEAHPVFGKYRIVVAAGSAKEDGMSRNDMDNVKAAITDDPWHTRTIIISVGKLTTGVTIPELTGVMMLCNVESPALYMQTAFRAQNPCLFEDGANFHRKANAYVFDFDPARTLAMFGAFADGLCQGGAARNDMERKRRIGELLNFFPVIGEDPGGKMVELDAERVLSVPREVYASRVVETGFRANCLFKNVGAVFSGEMAEIINKLTPEQEPKRGKKQDIDMSGIEHDPVTGEVKASDTTRIGLEQDLFGSKVYAPGADAVSAAKAVFDDAGKQDEPVQKPDVAKKLYERIGRPSVQKGVMAPLRGKFGKELGNKKMNGIEKKVESIIEAKLAPVADRFSEQHGGLVTAHNNGEYVGKEDAYHAKLMEIAHEAVQATEDAVKDAVAEARKDAVQECATAAMKKKQATAEKKIRDQLRGFSRTIPSFLMGYGTPDTTLSAFDLIVPDGVFLEVTGITMDEFRKLRDGCDAMDDETGELKHFGGVFDEGVFNSSVQLFLKKKEELASWFNEDQAEDIFNYIPPQRTSQIYTPRNVVRQMVDSLEVESPGCFESETNTFIDPYMKSGMYITEIVRRLFNSDRLKAVYPDDKERLKHIFEVQVYGLAPTEIIYRIAMTYIFGVDADGRINRDHFRQVDAAEYAKSGTLKEKIDELFG